MPLASVRLTSNIGKEFGVGHPITIDDKEQLARLIMSHKYGSRYERWLVEYLPKFRVLIVDEQTTTSYATVRGELKRAGTPIPSNDVWIAALCRQHCLPVLSRDRHFDLVPGLRRIDW